MIPNFATPSVTKTVSERHPLTYNRLGRSDLWISQIGFGGYRIDMQNAVHRAALSDAMTAGVNLIDTSSNYADGGSEELIGDVLRDLISAGKIRREEMVIVSKGGYIQGQNYALSQKRKADGNPFPDLVPYANQLEHCIHPDFLADQIGRSRDRLGVETIDVYLLHNPEYYLGWAKKMDFPLEDARQEFYRRIRLAFTHLEEEVANGRIAAYGVSANGLIDPADSYGFVSLHRIHQIAAEVSADHHFRVIQFPLNLLETGAITIANLPDGRTLLQLAAELELGTLTNRPLNAVLGNNLVRLADLPPQQTDVDADEDAVNETIRQLMQQEERLKKAVFDTDLPFRTKQEFAATTAAGPLLQQRWSGFGTFSNWRDVRDGYLRPRQQFAVNFLRRRPELPEKAAGWVDAYEDVFARLLNQITAVYREYETESLAQLERNVSNLQDDWRGTDTLSQTAVRVLRSTADVDCVLVGMRRPEYVTDIVTEAERAIPAKPRRQAWHKLAETVELAP